ncbi:MAG: hypothetical protein V4586_13515 [Pseudomonadota bacterium]
MRDTATNLDLRDGIRISDVKSMIAEGVTFTVTYHRCCTSRDGKPVFHAVYAFGGREALLVTNEIRPHARTFLLWPGLVCHHQKFGGEDQCPRLDVSKAKIEDRKCV